MPYSPLPDCKPISTFVLPRGAAAGVILLDTRVLPLTSSLKLKVDAVEATVTHLVATQKPQRESRRGMNRKTDRQTDRQTGRERGKAPKARET